MAIPYKVKKTLHMQAYGGNVDIEYYIDNRPDIIKVIRDIQIKSIENAFGSTDIIEGECKEIFCLETNKDE